MKVLKESDHYELFRLHSLVGWTRENAVAFMYGMHLDNMTNMNQSDFKAPFTSNKSEAIWKHF